MYHNYIARNVDTLLPTLCRDLLAADEVGSRAGRTRELMHVGITLENPWERELLTPGRKPSLAAQIAETMWILAGRDDVEWLTHYLPRAAEFSDDGATWRGAYGRRLRAWPRRGDDDVIDQLAHIVDLMSESPGTRRAVAMIYDPARDSQEGKDIPCNNWLSFSSRLGELDLHVAVRSNDLIWGWSGINTFEWSVIQEIVAGMLKLNVGALHFSTTSLHLYDRHWAKAEELSRVDVLPRLLGGPRFDARAVSWNMDVLDTAISEWFHLEEQIRTGNPSISAVNSFREPMMQSWLRVLQWWWSGNRDYLEPLDGSALSLATHYSVQPASAPEEKDERPDPKPEAFIERVIALHNEKHAAYGDSWCRRGEVLGILANVARKVDRLEGGETSDETRADTASDLLVYLAKYKAWIATDGQNDPDRANLVLREVASGQYQEWDYMDDSTLVKALQESFQSLELAVVHDRSTFACNFALAHMINDAYVLAERWGR